MDKELIIDLISGNTSVNGLITYLEFPFPQNGSKQTSQCRGWIWPNASNLGMKSASHGGRL